MNPLQDQTKRQPQVRFEDTTEVTCDNCGNNVFSVGTYMRKVSPILTGTGKPMYVPIEQAVYCVKCHHQNAEFMPEEFQKKSILAT